MTGLEIDFRCAARDVELAIDLAAGARLAVIGPNAAGKSTLLQVVAGLLQPDRGRVVLDGRVLTDTARRIRIPTHRRRVGLLAQAGLLFEHLTVLENVAFGPRSQHVPEARAVARSWLDRIGVGELAERRPAQLSGGQRQRVALARTLAADPDALLLDEPSSALDVRVAAELRGVLAEATRGRTTVLGSHDLLDIVSIADKVVVIEAGRLTECGSTRQLLARPTSAFAARLADVNVLPGELVAATTLRTADLLVHGLPDDPAWSSGPAIATLRPAAITVSLAEPASSARNTWQGPIATMLTVPHGVRLRVDIGTRELIADITAESAADLQLVPGQRVWLAAKAQEVRLSRLA